MSGPGDRILKYAVKVRSVVVAVLLAVLAAPGVQAQRTAKLWKVAALVPGPVECPVTAGAKAFVEALAALGYSEGRNLAIDRRCYDDRGTPPESAISGIVAWEPAVILVSGSPASVQVVRERTKAPVVFVNVPEDGLVQPGGNVTGITSQSRDLETRRVEILRQALPQITRVALLVGASQTTPERGRHDAIEAVADRLRLRLQPFEVSERWQLHSVFDAMAAQNIEAVIVLSDPFVWSNRARIVDLMTARKLPAIFPHRAFTDLGGLMSCSANLADGWRRAAGYVQKIVQGARPADLAVEEPKAFGLTLPPALLQRADQVIP